MKPNQRNRFNNRHNGTNRGARPQVIYRNTALESTGPCGKLRGTALQLYEKYVSAAKDALIQNDDILAETCFQYADHYMHIQNQAIANEQAFHAQQQAQRQAAVEQAQPEESTPEETVTAESEEGLKDGDLKVMDLSVPVASMNQNAEASKPTAPRSRRKLQMPRKSADTTDTGSSDLSV